MAQPDPEMANLLPGVVYDQPEIFESEPVVEDEPADNNNADNQNDEPMNENIAVIEVPIRQAFAYFAEREHEIARFYVQRHGEYKISANNPEEETEIEKYHRLVSEVNQLLNKFHTDQASQVDRHGMSMTSQALTNNLEILSKQLKALEFAAQDGSLNPTQSGYLNIQTKLNELKGKVTGGGDDDEPMEQKCLAARDETSKLIRMSALERRLNMLESLLGSNDDKVQNLFKATKCESLIDAAETLGSWLSLYKPDTLQRVSTEVDYLTQRLEKVNEQEAGKEDSKHLDAQAKSRLDQLYNLVTSTDKYRALVPTIIHRLSAMEELQQKAAQVATTVNHLEQVQSQIVESLRSNKGELSSLTEMFSRNIEFIKDFSRDIDSRITALRNSDQ